MTKDNENDKSDGTKKNMGTDFENVARTVKWSKAIAGIAVFLTSAIYFGWFNDQPVSLESVAWGSFGSYFGGILSPVMAGLAFYWITQSVLIQKEELRESRLALKEAANAQADQAKTLEKQRFEDTFFSLLEQHNQRLDELDRWPVDQHGDKSESILAAVLQLAEPFTLGETRVVMKQQNFEISSYFRVLYHLLKYIAIHHPSNTISPAFTPAEIRGASKPSPEEKMYSSLVRSFLGHEATTLLAYNCIDADEGHPYYEYRLLIERYSMLEHIDLNDTQRWGLVSHYEEAAFGDNPQYQMAVATVDGINALETNGASIARNENAG